MAAGRSDEIILRPGPDGVVLIPDRAYPQAYTLRVGGTDQSYVDLDDPTRFEFDYMQRIADIVDAILPAGERVRTVHVGGAALTLPRYIAATRPRSAQVVLEPDAELTDFVRRHLPLPPRSGIKVRAVDGRTGVAELADGYAELVIVDAFVGARVPAELTTAEFFAELARVVTPGGVVVVNLTDRGPLGYAVRVLKALTTALPAAVLCAEPATLKGRRFGNVLLAATDARLPVTAIADRAGRSAYPYRVLHGGRLDQLLGGVRPFTDADGEQSPEPPGGLSFFA